MLASGTRHELPHPHGTGMTAGAGVVAALNKWQVSQGLRELS